ncbi:MAG TPA: acetolactate synthase [Planctomycetaceae bacterium]|nr:acetolactate synthase [Planctomycetaceae bacterium]
MSSRDFGDQSAIDASTMRGRSWPCLRQFCVFMENRVGGLNELLRHLERHDLRVVALSIANSVDCAIVRVMLNDTDRGRELFKLSNFAFAESDLVGVELPDDPQPYLRICMALLQAELNIHYTYPLLYRRAGHGAIALYVDDVDLALRTLTDKGHRLITETDLLHDDPY